MADTVDKATWTSIFTNNPYNDFNLYLELLENEQPIAKIERDNDGELYLSIFSSPGCKIPYNWLVSLAARVKTLPENK